MTEVFSEIREALTARQWRLVGLVIVVSVLLGLVTALLVAATS